MELATPAFAIVRPRVLVTRSGESRLLDEVVGEIADEYGSGIVRLAGGPGSGKSTALAHLAAVFTYNEHVNFLDEPTPSQLAACSGDSIVVAAMPPGGGRHLELALQPWGIDELIEYLLAEHHDVCGSVIERLGAAANYRWLPQIATIVLSRFATDVSLNNPVDALLQYVEEQLPKVKQRDSAAKFSLAMLIGGSERLETSVAKVVNSHFPLAALNLLRHEMVQLPLAAERLRRMISNGDFGELEQKLPRKLVKLVGRRCADTPQTINQLVKLLSSQRAESSHAMAASILMAADPGWQPFPRQKPWRLAGGVFRYAKWSKTKLIQACLDGCDFDGADLQEVDLNDASMNSASFDEAMLCGASLRVTAHDATFRGASLAFADLRRAKLCRADFEGANLHNAVLMDADLTGAQLLAVNLQDANLANARLTDAKLEDADLTGAILRGADLTRVDLRRVALNGVCLEEAIMIVVQMEDVRIVGAKLQKAKLFGAHLTGSSLPGADLRSADLSGAGLAEINWEGADLRGANLRSATFHMGSSRSGLVDSPYACEGSKMGFYTDDYEDMSFKRPEEVRKANLCGADLRGVLAERVDFYLVDLRGAKLDPALREQARDSGAILEEVAG